MTERSRSKPKPRKGEVSPRQFNNCDMCEVESSQKVEVQTFFSGAPEFLSAMSAGTLHNVQPYNLHMLVYLLINIFICIYPQKSMYIMSLKIHWSHILIYRGI